MVCEEVSVYVSWLRTMSEFDFKKAMINVSSPLGVAFGLSVIFDEMGLEAKENSCAEFLELREENI